jgi:hypothetical protein
VTTPEEGAGQTQNSPIPLGQRLFDSPFLLLIAGFLIMACVYTLWGLWEIMSLPQATLP